MAQWSTRGVADGGKILSYIINMDRGHQTIRHISATSHDPEITQNLEGDDQTKIQPQGMNPDTREKVSGGAQTFS